MAMGTIATAAGGAMLLFYVLSQRLSPPKEGEDELSGDLSKLSRSGRRRTARRPRPRPRPVQPPATWFEAITTATETLRFAYSETLGKWPFADLTFGINYLSRRQDPLQVASVYAGSDCVQLKGPEIRAELTHHLRLLTLCLLFSKNTFSVFLETAGCSKEDVLLQEPKAGLLKPAFTIICDRSSKCFLLLIRGMHSIEDTLTAATGTVVPFHHSVLHEGGVSNLVLGYAHCGMVAAARWIAKHSTPCLLKALAEWPDYSVKIVGNSLGAGIASLLTYILRERKEFSSTTCIAFAPASCMTWDLAESGKHCITTIINGSDLVPSCSPASVDDLRSEITSSSWLSDLRDQLEHTRFLDVFRSATALGSCLPAIARERVADAGALLRPVSSSTQVVMKRAQRNVAQAVVRTRSSLSSWSCMGARRRAVGLSSNSKEEGDAPESLLISKRIPETFFNEAVMRDPEVDKLECCSSTESGHDETEEEEELIPVDCMISTSTVEDMTEGEVWYELEKELHRQEIEGNVQVQEEEEAAAKEITEEEKVLVDAVDNTPSTSLGSSETHRFYPPGRIMHIVARPPSDAITSGGSGSARDHVGIYETPRDLYSKIRLSKAMIHDHYINICKTMMELLLSELEKDGETGTSV